jgi:CCR4-NOT transcription complex subunit 9
MEESKQGREHIYQLVHDLIIHDKREEALIELSRNREAFTELAPILWHSIGTIAAL